MSTRMDKYKDEYNNSEKRTERNQKIYSKVKDEDIDGLSLTNNISIIDTNTDNLDINRLRELLDERYKKNTAAEKTERDTDVSEEEVEDTKEYDLKKVIDEVRRNKSSDYDHDRFKKLREDEYEILSSLNIEKTESQETENMTPEETNLMNLIKTVTVNENAQKNANEGLDLLDDLKATDESDILEPLPMEDEPNPEPSDIDTETGKKPTLLEELERTKQISKTEIMEKLEHPLSHTEIVEMPIAEEKVQPVENTFYTGSLTIKDSDLDDFKDLEREINSNNILVKILVFIAVLIGLAIIVYLLNKYLDLGLF